VTAVVLLYIFSLLLQLFSYIYWSYGTTKNFSMNLSHLDSFYLALGTLTTAGTGAISATSETARGIQTLQIGLDLIFVGIVVSLVLARYSNLLNRPQMGAARDGVMTVKPTTADDSSDQPQHGSPPTAKGPGHPHTEPQTSSKQGDTNPRPSGP
jgi:hypothetical protein